MFQVCGTRTGSVPLGTFLNHPWASPSDLASVRNNHGPFRSIRTVAEAIVGRSSREASVNRQKRTTDWRITFSVNGIVPEDVNAIIPLVGPGAPAISAGRPRKSADETPAIRQHRPPSRPFP